MLQVSANRLKGMLPSSMANLSSALDWLALGDNQIYGDLPLGLSNLFSLSRMFMQGNQLTGHIPPEVGKLGNLERLFLNHNRFSGQIPTSIGNLSMLSELHLGHNELSGTIPPTLGNCSNLRLVVISQNNLSGFIPIKLFAIPDLSVSLNLAQNQLVGPLPLEIAKLFNLNELVLSQNKLSGNIPRELGQCKSLVNLYIDKNNFQGTIPLSLRSLKGLKIFDLSRNNLSGRIPEYLGRFALDYLNLSFNNFEGRVPINGVFSNASAISVEGNDRLCGGISQLQLPRCNSKLSRESHEGKMGLIKIIVPTITSCLIIAILLAFLYCRFTRKKKGQSSQSFPMGSMWKLSYENILKATDGFSSANLVGIGTFGCVYKGTLDQDGPIIAVKVLNLQQQGAYKSFIAECKALRNVRHRNLVKVITSCSSIDFQGNDFKAIIYEFMPNGSLDKWLHQDVEINNGTVHQRQNLSLLQRINIAIDIANALDYLHNQCQNPIIHCDLKPSNVLLDSDMTAHVGDFGLAKFYTQVTSQNQNNSFSVRGTIGYTAPEYGLGSMVSTSGDIYSYGILLLEMMTGKTPVDNVFGEVLNLHKFAEMGLPDKIEKIVDPFLLNDDGRTIEIHQSPSQVSSDHTIKCLVSMVKIGVACSVESPEDRMGIPNVVNELQKIKNFLQGRSRAEPFKY